MDNRLFVGRLINVNNIKDSKEFFEENKKLVKEKVFEYLNKHKALKISLSTSMEYLIKKADNEILDSFYFNGNLEIFDQVLDFNDWYNNSLNKLEGFMSEFQKRGSGATLSKINHLELNIAKYDQLRGGSYIKLPKCIDAKKACINIRNANNNFCFAYSILAYFYPAKTNSTLPSSYPRNFINLFNFDNINFPTTFKDIKKFESQNANISINVYVLSDSNTIQGPVYYSENKKTNHINLLLLNELEKQHYVLIKDLAKLCGKQISKHGHKITICDKCLQFFYNKEKFIEHNELCENFNNVKIKFLSKEKSILKF